MSDPVFMPDGKPFPFWDDRTAYERVYHVACAHPAASDDGPGTEERPWATIGRAAAALQPAEKVVVHAGIYRERVSPARGGEGPDRMIAYEAAPGEAVYVRGSRVWQPTFAPSQGWDLGALPSGSAGMDGRPASAVVRRLQPLPRPELFLRVHHLHTGLDGGRVDYVPSAPWYDLSRRGAPETGLPRATTSPKRLALSGWRIRACASICAWRTMAIPTAALWR